MSFSPLKQEKEQLPFYQNHSSWAPFFLTEKQAQTLLKAAVPITFPYTDLQGRTIQLWKYINLFAASITKNGLTTLFSSNKIHNALLPEESSELFLKRLESSSLKKWHFSYLEETKRIFIWPFLIGGGVDKYKLAYNAVLNLEHKENKTSTEQQLFNIIKKNLRESEELIGAKKEVREEILTRDGKPFNHQTEVNCAQNGIKSIIEDIEKQLKQNLSPSEKTQLLKERSIASLALDYTKRFLPSKSKAKTLKNPHPNPQNESFKDRVRANRLMESYNSCHPDHPIDEGSSGRHIGGVENEVGIILGLFDNLSGKMESEHTFFLPVVDKLSLDRKEIQRILQELALGIFVYNTVPFFSLHFNGDTNMYPVIHPAYQNTFVGYVISMLDYYMKGFLNGGFFSAAFVQEWNKNHNISEKDLEEQLVDVREYCKNFLGFPYLSIREMTEIFERMEALEPMKCEEHPILKDYSGFNSSFRIIAHQNSIKKVEDLFILDGNFDVLYTITPDPAYEQELTKHRQLTGEDPSSYRRLEKVYDKMSLQIKHIMPRIPEFKKLFEALNIISFFCYYFNTLKKANKFPLLSHRVFENTDVCPPLFPHLPLRAFYHEKIKLKLTELFIHQEKKHLIEQAILTNREKAVQYVAEEIQKYISRKNSYPLSKKQQEVSSYQKTASDFLQRLEATYVKAKAERFPKLDDLIREWETIHTNLSSSWNAASAALAGTEHQYVRQRNIQICNNNLKKLKEQQEQRSNLLEHPLSLLDLEAFIELQIENMDSTLHLYTQHKLEEEKQLQKRIVGGCGVALSHEPMRVDPIAYSLLNRHFGQLSGLLNEEIREISDPGNNGVLFKLCFTDFSFIDEGEKQAALSYLSPTSMSAAMIDIFHAIATDDEKRFEKTAEQITSWGFHDSHGMNPLHYAASVANTCLLDRVMGKVAIHIRDSQGHTALHFAAQSGNLEGIELLLSKAPGLLDMEATGGVTALYVAIQHAKLHVVQSLLAKGANPNCKTAHGMNALMCAIYRGFVEIALELLNRSRIDLKHTLDDKTTALHLAVECKSMLPVIEKMIANRIDVNQARWDGHTALHLAAKQGNLSFVRALLKAYDMNLNAQLKSGKTALHLAVENDHYEIVELLLENKADPLLFGWNRETTLITAVRSGSINSALCLLSYVKKQTVTIQEKQALFVNVKDIHNQTALEIAAKFRIEDLWLSLFNPAKDDPKNTALQPMDHLLLLCQPGVDFDVIDFFQKKHQLHKPEQLMQTLITSAKNGHNVAVSRFYSKLDAEGFRYANGWSIHHHMAKFDHINFFSDIFSHSKLPSSQQIEEWATVAARYGSMRSLKILLDVLHKRKLLPSAGKKPLLEAVQAGQRKTADLIIHKILEPNIPLEVGGKYASHIAVINNDEEMVEFLLGRGVKFHLPDKKNLSAFHYAILYNQKKIVEFLLDPKKRVEIPADLLHFAAAKASPEILDFILKHTSNINALNPVKKETALLSAVRENNLTNTNLLCLRGASLHTKNSNGETPFLLAAKQNSSLLQFLLQYNPPYQVTDQGENALHLAAMHNQDENVELLLNHNFDATILDHAQKTPLMHAQEKQFFDICDILQGKRAQLERAKKTIVESLMNGQQNSFFSALKNLPINKSMTFIVPHIGKTCLPILHLIDLLVSEEKKKKEILEKFVQKYQVDINMQTAQGNTLLHIAAIKDQDPPFKKMNALVPNGQGITPLHLFAQSASLARFTSIFSEIDKDALDREDKEMQTPLFYAIQKNRLDIVSFLLDKGANPNHRSKTLMTPLGLAIEKNSLPIVRTLAEKGVCIESLIGVNGERALHIAVRKGFDEIAKYLVEKTTNMYQKDRQGKEPIHVAAAKGNQNMVRFLHACGASLFSIDYQGNGLAYFAAQSKCPELIDFLKEHEVPLDPLVSNDFKPKKAPLHMATIKGNLPMITQFSRYKADFEVRDSEGDTSLVYATISENAEILELFSESPLMNDKQQVYRSIITAIQLDSVPQIRILQRELKSIDQSLEFYQNITMLHVACQFGAIRIVHYLLKERADPLLKMHNGASAFDLAVLHNHVEIARAISYQIKINPNQKLSKGKNYLHLAAEKDSSSMIALLYLEGADLDALDAEGSTPLHVAVEKENMSAVKLLLALGAKTTIETFKSQTIYDMIQSEEIRALVTGYEKIFVLCQDLKEGRLHAAVRMGNADVLPILARIHDLHQSNIEGRTPLHIATLQRNFSVLRRLLELEIDPDFEVRDHQGKTPLFIAATETKDPQLVQFLLNLGANPKVKTNDGLSLLDAVKQNSKTEQTAVILNLLTTL
jgi:ankyrin repeat protein